MKPGRILKRIVTNLHFLVFVNGFLIAFFILFKIQANREDLIFNSIAKKITSVGELEEDSLIKSAVHTTHYLLRRRSEIFSGVPATGFVDEFIHPLSTDMMTADGACGSYSAVLCGVLRTMNIQSRFAQMKVDGVFGGHIIIEAKTSYGWAVLDPLYNLSFKRADGKLASFQDVSTNWDLYKQQVPENYDGRYRYEDVRYTNWNKIPVLMPALKKVMSLFMSDEELQGFSFRTFFIKKYAVIADFLFLIILPLSIYLIAKLIYPRLAKKLPIPYFFDKQPRENSLRSGVNA